MNRLAGLVTAFGLGFGPVFGAGSSEGHSPSIAHIIFAVVAGLISACLYLVTPASPKQEKTKMQSEVQVTLTISSPSWENPLVLPVVGWDIAAPTGADLSFKATSPAGSLTETITSSCSIDGVKIWTDRPVTKLPIDLPGFLGVLAEEVTNVDSSIVLDLKTVPVPAAA